jgi:hypothetical protein
VSPPAEVKSLELSGRPLRVLEGEVLDVVKREANLLVHVQQVIEHKAPAGPARKHLVGLVPRTLLDVSGSHGGNAKCNQENEIEFKFKNKS